MKRRAKHTILCVILVALVFFLLTSCRTKTVYVPVETVRTEYKDQIFRDSLRLYDSIYVREANDTIRIEKYKYIYRDKLIRDSVFDTDSVAVPFPVVETIQVNKVHNWQIILMCLGGVLIGYVAILIFRKIKI